MSTVEKMPSIAEDTTESLTRTLKGLERIFNSIIDTDCFGMEPSRKTLSLHNQLKGGIESVKEIIHKDLQHGSKKKSKKRSKKKTKSKGQDKGGNTYDWKVGDCVRPIGMPTYYTITKNYDKDNWLMSAPSGGGHVITDIIPKEVENSGTWEKVQCQTGSKDGRSKKKSKKKSKKTSKKKSKKKSKIKGSRSKSRRMR